MLVLYETPAGYSLFKVLKDDIVDGDASKVQKHFKTAEKAASAVKLHAFKKFEDTVEAVSAATALVESKVDKALKKFLKKHVKAEDLAVSDSKLGNAIKEKLGIQCVNNDSAMEVIRGLRAQFPALSKIEADGVRSMTLGLAHSLSRYKLKFSPDKVDTMIVQAINLLDELDKEINTYAMRVKEWYGWHFPELSKIVQDNVQYVQVILKVGFRNKISAADFSDIMPEEIEREMKATAEISMGTEISDTDILNISALAEQVLSMGEYRAQLFDYLKNRMMAIAPNLTIMVGELVGARLIAHAGSLMNLAKAPASTVQILGAEKALFRALKTKHDTPKYGLIYHASLIGQSAPKNKGKISRVLAAKTALAIRVDALGDATEPTIGYECREKVEARLRQLETGRPYSLGETSASAKKASKYSNGESAKSYNDAADDTMAIAAASAKKEKRKREEGENGDESPKKKKSKKDKKKKKKEDRYFVEDASSPDKKDKKKKKKKKKKSE